MLLRDFVAQWPFALGFVACGFLLGLATRRYMLITTEDRALLQRVNSLFPLLWCLALAARAYRHNPSAENAKTLDDALGKFEECQL
jgi:hypothetical protein